MDFYSDFNKLEESFYDIDCFRYSAYRTALKIRRIQKSCKLHLIDLIDISTMNHDNYSIINFEDVECLLNSLYNAINKSFGSVEDMLKCIEVICNLLSKSFCRETSDSLFLYEIKLILSVFCGAEVTEKYKYIVDLFAINDCMTKKQLHVMLTCLAKICEALGESSSFGEHTVHYAMKNCVFFCHESYKIPKDRVIEWLFREPQTLVWLPVHHRISISEGTKHDVKCSICQRYPLFGLRYTCLCCFNYNMCQYCFLLGCANKGHKLKHPVKEHCLKVTHWMKLKTFIRIIKSRSCFLERNKKNYLGFEKEGMINKSNSQTEERFLNGSVSHNLDGNSIFHELTNIMEKLEESNRQMYSKIEQNANISNEHRRMKKINPLISASDLKMQLLRLHDLIQNLKTLLKENCMEDMCWSPELKDLVDSIGGYCESTPVLLPTHPSSDQDNLINFIKCQSNGKKLGNTMQNFPSNYQEPPLYTVADIESPLCKSRSVNFSNETLASENKKNKVLRERSYSLEPIQFSDNSHNVANSKTHTLAVSLKNHSENKTSESLKTLMPTINSISSVSKIYIPRSGSSQRNSFHETELQEAQNMRKNSLSGSEKHLGNNALLHILSEMEQNLIKLSVTLSDTLSFSC